MISKVILSKNQKDLIYFGHLFKDHSNNIYLLEYSNQNYLVCIYKIIGCDYTNQKLESDSYSCFALTRSRQNQLDFINLDTSRKEKPNPIHYLNFEEFEDLITTLKEKFDKSWMIPIKNDDIEIKRKKLHQSFKILNSIEMVEFLV